jgi:hypothetical protein
MARNAGGTYALPLSAVVTGTVIASTWANTTLNDLATEMTDSLDRSGKGGMLAPLLLTNGTAGSPSVAFTAESSTGMYRGAAVNTLAFAVAGANQLVLTTAASAPAAAFVSPQAGGGSQDDFQFKTTNTRTLGNIFNVIDNATSVFLLDNAGNAAMGGAAAPTLTVGSSGGGMLRAGFVSAVLSTNTSLTLTGNRSAADAGTDLVLNSTAARTAGKLFDLQNNGATVLNIANAATVAASTLNLAAGSLVFANTGSISFPAGGGTVTSAGPLLLVTTASDGPVTIKGNRNAASTTGDIILNSSVNRSAGLLLDAQNNSVSKLGITFEGAIEMTNAVSPASTATGYGTKVTKKSIVSAWGNLTTGAAGAVTVNDGYNIASASWATTALTVTFATAMNSANYMVVCNLNLNTTTYVAIYSAAGTNAVTFTTYNSAFVQQNWTSGLHVYFVCVGGM